MRINGKRLLKTAAATTVGRRLAGDFSSRVVVLCYHSIHPRKSFASATPDLFARHLEWLRAHCDLVDLVEIPEQSHRHRARPAVAITFDDGYEDNYIYALPLLREYAVPATIFVTVGAVERDWAVLERLREVRQATMDEVAPLTWGQIAEMHEEGIRFGSHTYSHPNLARLSRERARCELVQSKEIMEDRLEVQVTSLAYPFGKRGAHFTSETIRLARAAGYECAAAIRFRCVRPQDNLYAIPRFFATGDSVESLKAKVRGDWDVVGVWQEFAPTWLARVVSPAEYSVE